MKIALILIVRDPLHFACIKWGKRAPEFLTPAEFVVVCWYHDDSVISKRGEHAHFIGIQIACKGTTKF